MLQATNMKGAGTMQHTATYSPDDNKLRLYPAYRLDKDDYNRVRAAGFIWAGKQELFVAPAWTPEREDLLIEMCGEIGDEDTSLTERAEERAERFEGYSENRADEAEQARKAVSAIADNIPLGQPILVGHHSERHARKDAERIQNGMRKAVKLWETSQYWTGRAARALRHAKYKERPDVRARRIKAIEADKRKQEKYKAEAATCLQLWTRDDLTREQAVLFAGHTRAGYLSLPRKEGDKPDFQQCPDAYTALTNSYPSLYAPRTLEEVVDVARKTYPRTIERCERWINHFNNRLEYERAMMAEQGGTEADKTKPEKGGACKCWASPRGGWSYIQKVNRVSVTVLDNWGNSGRNFTRTIPFDKLAGVMSLAEVQAARDAGRLIEDETKRGFALTDEPVKKNVGPQPQEPTVYDVMKDTLKAGVQVVSVPQLFPTPPDLAAQMVERADIQPGHRVLEPSAGTGRLVDAMDAIPGAHVIAVELSHTLADNLRLRSNTQHEVKQGDFLSMYGDLGTFDRIVMNPPFGNAQDIAHIEHALTMLKPGGRLVALCANGPRQQDKLKPIATEWHDLPAGSFKEAGTGVNVAMLVIDN